MSAHPNVILMAVLKPDGLSRKTMREIVAEYPSKHNEEYYIGIGEKDYSSTIMESDYDDEWQIAADEGDLIFLDFVTYGYGRWIAWNDLEKQKVELEKWAKEVSKKFHCSFEIRVSANYW